MIDPTNTTRQAVTTVIHPPLRIFSGRCAWACKSHSEILLPPNHLQMSSVPATPSDHQVEPLPHSNPPSNWTINVSDVRTIKVSNVSLDATENDIRGFFSDSGEIRYIELQRQSDTARVAYVTFKEHQGADTALLLSGSTIAGLPVTIAPVEDYYLPPEATASPPTSLAAGSAVEKAEDVVSTMLAKGYVLGKDALNKAKALDERIHLTSNVSVTVAALDLKMGLSQKISIGKSVVNEKVREMDERFRVSEMMKSALAVAEQKASSAGNAIMSNSIVSTGASWVSGAFTAVAKAASDFSMMTKEKVEKAEEDKKETLVIGGAKDLARIQLDDPLKEERPVAPVNSEDPKLGNI